MFRLFYVLLFAAMVFVANAGVHHYQVGGPPQGANVYDGNAHVHGARESLGHHHSDKSRSARGPDGGSFLNDLKSTGSKAFHQAFKGISHVLHGKLF